MKTAKHYFALALVCLLVGCATQPDYAREHYTIVDDDPNAPPVPTVQSARHTPSSFTACDMAKAAFTSRHADTRRLGASWFASGACD